MLSASRSHRRWSQVAAASALLLASALLASCGGGSDVTASIVSEERPTRDDSFDADDAPELTEDVAEFCNRAAELQLADDDSDDPAAQLAALESLRVVAPAELEEHFDVLADVVERMSVLDEDDPEALGEMFAIAFDPEVLIASEAISSFTSRECGIDLDAGDGMDGSDDAFGDDGTFGDDDMGGFEDDDPTDIELEDVDAVKDAAEGQVWADKLNSTLISGSVDVQLAAQSTDPITPEDALTACTTLWQALSLKNPAVTVKIMNFEQEVAVSGPDGTCTLV